MAMISKMGSVVFRVFFNRQLGARVHVLSGESELVMALSPVRILQGEAPREVCDTALVWARQHRDEVLMAWGAYLRKERPLTLLGNL